jgi:hypothetical protein
MNYKAEETKERFRYCYKEHTIFMDNMFSKFEELSNLHDYVNERDLPIFNTCMIKDEIKYIEELKIYADNALDFYNKANDDIVIINIVQCSNMDYINSWMGVLREYHDYLVNQICGLFKNGK